VAGNGHDPTWSDLQSGAAEQLGSTNEARWLLEEVTGERYPTGPPSPRHRNRFDALVARRLAGEPLQYVLGSWGFRTLDLMVDQRVLIPRPETEQVVEVALAELDRLAADPDRRRRPRIAVDLGTGSGAIALSIAAERTDVEVWATDLSQAALDVAAANLAGLGGRAAARVRLVQGAWWAALPQHLRGHIDLLVSNPPYVSTAEMSDLDRQVVAWEPALALDAGPTGLEAVEEILAGAGPWLASHGVAVIEIAPHQADAAVTAARRAGFTEVDVRPDLAGRDRALVARGTATEVAGP
jgi:release factor glutamine methyltransferase